MSDANYTLKLTRQETNDVVEALQLLKKDVEERIIANPPGSLPATEAQHGRIEFLLRRL